MRLRLLLVLFLAVGAASPALADPWQPFTEWSFKQAQKDGAPVVVGVYSRLCGPCKLQEAAVTPILERDYPGIAAFRLWFSDEDGFLEDYEIYAPTTLLVFRDRKEVARIAGVVDAGKLKTFLEQALGD